jgi:hypothetical protein
MSELQEAASLHEKAVQAIARGEVAPMPKRRRKASQRRSEPVHTHVVVDKRVMQQAQLIILAGSYTKVEIINENEVIVR